MLNKIKQIFNKKVLAFSLFLILSIAGAVGFIFADKKEQTNLLLNTVSEKTENTKYIEQEFLALSVKDETQPIVSKTSTGTNNAENGNWGDTTGNISGGQEIIINNGSSTFIINNGSSNVLEKTFTPNAGYNHSGFAIYIGNSESGTLVFTITFGSSKLTVTNGSGGAVTSGGTISVSDPQFKCMPEDIITSGYSSDNNKIFIKALTTAIEYNFTGYYQDGSTASGYTAATAEYTIDATKDLTIDSDSMLGKPTSDFGYWILRKAAVKSDEYNGYTVLITPKNKVGTSEENGEITICKDSDGDGLYTKKDDVKVILSYNGVTNKGYKLDSLLLDSEKTSKQTRGYSFGTIVQDSTNPLIAAKISRTYTSKITSGTEGWNSNSLVDEDTKEDLVGAVSSGEGAVESSAYEAKLTIKDNPDYAYKFMDSKKDASNGYSFYKREDFYTDSNLTNLKEDAESATNGKYAVFNYGYQITGWKVYFVYKGNNYALNDALNLENTISDVEISNLSSFDMRQFAALIDLHFEGEAVSSEDISVEMVPEWGACSITLSAKGGEDYSTATATSSTSYYASYKLDIADPVGKSSINYKTTSGNIVVQSGTYNYIAIPKIDYTYFNGADSEDDDTDSYYGNYTLALTAEYVDNMYQVKLIGITDGDDGDTLDTSCGYESSTAVYDKKEVYSYSNYEQSGYKYEDYSSSKYSSGLIENYITNTFDGLKKQYTTGIDGAFDILNKVYKGKNDDGTEFFYIYLTNAHAYNMPVFTRSYYDLIFYTNVDNKKTTFKYKTAVYDNAADTEKVDYANAAGKYDFNKNLNWNRSDHGDDNTNKDLSIEAYWFRKYYNLDINTLLNSKESFNGYVKVEILDEDVGTESGNYVVLYNDGMKIYNYSENTIKELKLNTFLKEADNVTPLQYIKLYAGCKLTLNAKDQSKDTYALSNSYFENMVGYRYTSMLCNTLVGGNDFINVVQGVNSHDYQVVKNKDDFNTFNSGVLLIINFNFEQIQYKLNVKLDNLYAGDIKVVDSTNSQQTGSSEYKIPFTANSLTIGENYTIIYNANVGFELQNNAFTLTLLESSGNSVLQTDKKGGTTFVQTYTLKFTSAWLRDYYYNVFKTDFDTEDVLDSNSDSKPKLQININTKAIDFKVGLKVYDGTSYKTLYVYEDATKELFITDIASSSSGTNVAFKLNEATGSGKISFTIGNLLTNSDAGYMFKISEKLADGSIVDKEYVLLSSRMYSANQDGEAPANITDMYNRDYDFLLKTAPAEYFELDSSMLSKMLTYSINKIVPQANRELFIILQVCELYTLNVEVSDSDNPDPNGDRSVTVSNGVNSNVTVNGKPEDGLTLYTYIGAINTISYNANSKMYSGIECFVDGKEIVGTLFKTEANNQKLTVKYKVQPLAIQVEYFIDGVAKTEQQMLNGGYIKDVSITALSGYVPIDANDLYFGNKVVYNCTLNNIDYLLTVTINKNEYTLNSYYEITASDYYFEGINIVVNLEERPKHIIQVRYALIGNAIAGEPYYGTIEVFEGAALTPEANENTTGSKDVIISVVEGRKVYFDLHVNEGYKYYGYKFNTNSINTTKIVDEISKNYYRLDICDSYTQADHSGLYIIYLEKIAVATTLAIESDYNSYNIDNEYATKSYSPNGKIQTLTGVYVNYEIKFTSKEEDKEKLAYFYYTDKTGNKEIVGKTYDISSNTVIIDSVTYYVKDKVLYLDNAYTQPATINYVVEEDIVIVPASSLIITSNILENLQVVDGKYVLNFEVKTTPKYKITYSVTGAEYVQSFEVVSKEKGFVENCISGTFLETGSKIIFNLTTIETNKYQIYVYKNSVLEGSAVYSLTNKEYDLTQDLNIVIQVVPMQYQVTITEGIYNNLFDLNNKKPTVVTAGTYSGLRGQSNSYKQQKTLYVNIQNKQGSVLVNELQTMVITDLSLKTESLKQINIVVTYSNNSVSYVVLDEDGVAVTNAETLNYISSMYNFTIETNKLKISYTTMDKISINLTYISYKEIKQED